MQTDGEFVIADAGEDDAGTCDAALQRKPQYAAAAANDDNDDDDDDDGGGGDEKDGRDCCIYYDCSASACQCDCSSLPVRPDIYCFYVSMSVCLSVFLSICFLFLWLCYQQ